MSEMSETSTVPNVSSDYPFQEFVFETLHEALSPVRVYQDGSLVTIELGLIERLGMVPCVD